MNDDAEKRGHITVGTGARRGHSGGAEMPLTVLVMADFVPRAAEAKSKRVSIDKNNFNEVMKRLRPRLSLDVPNRVGKTPKEISVELAFDDIKSFRPETIVAQVGPLEALMNLRVLLTELRDGRISKKEFQERTGGLVADSELVARLQTMLTAPRAVAKPAAGKPGAQPPGGAPPKPGADKDGLGSLFDMVEVAGDKPATSHAPVSALDGLIDAIVRPKAEEEPIDKKVVDAIIADLDGTLSAQVNEVLHQEKFRRLESTWRGLKFLVDRTDFRENIRIDILNVTKNDLRDVLYERVFRPEYDGVTDEPVSVIAAEHGFDRSPHDTELLQDVSKMAESIQVPFIGSVGPGFFGLKSLGTLPGLPSLADKFQQPEYAKWNGFRDTDQARWVALAANRFLLRLPYGPESVPVKGFGFEEVGASVKQKHYVWGDGVWVLATALTASFAETGWCLDISGPKSLGAVSDLPVRQYTVHGGEKINIPLEILIPDQRGSEMADAGLIPIVCRPNDDMACVASVRTTHRPKRYDDPAVTQESALHATLPYQLFASRMAYHLQRIQRQVGTGGSKEEVEGIFKEGIRMALMMSGKRAPAEAVQVEVTDSSETPDYYDVTLRIRPPFTIFGQSVDLLLGLELRK